MTQLTHGSLFAGIGGFDLGFARAGIKTVWQVEIDPFCRKVLEKHWPHVTRYDDIRECCGSLLRQDVDSMRCAECGRLYWLRFVDVLTGGFPCQPFSTAGRRKGASDNRYLWPEMFRVIRELYPRVVVAENVGGFVSIEGGRHLDQVHDDLEGAGYETLPPFVIPACAVGANHIRNRVWIVAHAKRSGWREQVQFEATQKPLSPTEREEGASGLRPGGENLANADSSRLPNSQGSDAFAECVGFGATSDSGWWDVEPALGRVADGLSRRMDRPRLKSLGNAVVPQIAEWIGRRIVACHERNRKLKGATNLKVGEETHG